MAGASSKSEHRVLGEENVASKNDLVPGDITKTYLKLHNLLYFSFLDIRAHSIFKSLKKRRPVETILLVFYFFSEPRADKKSVASEHLHLQPENLPNN